MELEPQKIRIEDFTYELPESKIAKYPLPERDSSKLLIYHEGRITEEIYRNLAKYIPQESLLIFNDTKVIQARIHFRNSTGGKIEVFCLEPSSENPEPSSAMNQKKESRWKCLVGRAAKWKEKTIRLQADKLSVTAEIIKRSGSEFTIEFRWEPEELSFSEVLGEIGEMPIPPYLKRESETIDDTRYQTVYSKQKGSVAAPTAGLHFTENLFESLKKRSIAKDFVTLHVGAGTFIPVKSQVIQDHEMHSEWIEVKNEVIENLIQHLTEKTHAQLIIAVGTTSLRTIESLYWMGVKAHQNSNLSLDELELKQWEVYEMKHDLSAIDSLTSLLNWLKKNNLNKLVCKTQIIIVPSYSLKIAKALLTNFHQPNSTLLLLVAAIAGDEWKKIYNYALQNNFRFLSYGDGCLIFNGK